MTVAYSLILGAVCGWFIQPVWKALAVYFICWVCLNFLLTVQ